LGGRKGIAGGEGRGGRGLTEYMANLQLFQLFLHFLRHSSPVSALVRPSSVVLIHASSKLKESKGYWVYWVYWVYITFSVWLMTMGFLYKCDTHLVEKLMMSKIWDSFTANWNSSSENQKAPSGK